MHPRLVDCGLSELIWWWSRSTLRQQQTPYQAVVKLPLDVYYLFLEVSPIHHKHKLMDSGANQGAELAILFQLSSSRYGTETQHMTPKLETHIDKWSEDCWKQLSQNVFMAARCSQDIWLAESYRSTTPITASISSRMLISKGEKRGCIPFSCYNKFCVVPKVLGPTDQTWCNPLASSWPLIQWPSSQKRANKMMLCGSEKQKWDQQTATWILMQRL